MKTTFNVETVKTVTSVNIQMSLDDFEALLIIIGNTSEIKRRENLEKTKYKKYDSVEADRAAKALGNFYDSNSKYLPLDVFGRPNDRSFT
jgi:hypothetical protein